MFNNEDIQFYTARSFKEFYLKERRGRGYTVLPLSVCLSVQNIFHRIFLSFWTHQIPTSSLPILLIFIHIQHTFVYAHFSSHFSQQLLTTGIWYLVTSFIEVGIWWVQKLRKMRWKIFWTDKQTDRGKTVYPLPLRGAGVYKHFSLKCPIYAYVCSVCYI
jgi:hypothetical protein